MSYFLEDVEIDVILSEGYTSNTPATDHALEDNSEISDHVAREPKTITIDCIVLDEDNSKFNLLQQYQDEGRILNFDYLTSLDSVVIESVSVPRTADIKDGYEITIAMKQIKIVNRKMTALTSGAVERATRNKKQMGLHIPQNTSNEGAR